jgi:2-dehydropantoate 2-reductase
MKIAVFGAGGVGGYFGGRLAEAGHEVTLIARGEHLNAIRRDGLRVESVAGDFAVRPARAVADPSEAGPSEAVLVAVKAWQVPDVARLLPPLLDTETFVVPLENGVEAPGQIAAEIGGRRVVPGLCKLVSSLAGPGRIRHAGVEPWIAFGEPDGTRTQRVERLLEAFAQTRGVRAEIATDIQTALWEKFLFIAPFSSVAAAARMRAGPLRRTPETRRLLAQAMEEVFRLARARGVGLADDAVERTIKFVDSLPEGATASMQRDLLEGRPSELENQTGAVVRLGREASVPVPVSEFLYAILLPSEQKARAT